MSRAADRRRVGLALAAALAATTAGCADMYYDRRETVSFQAGDAVAHNIAVQTVDPWPRVAGSRYPQADGQRAAGAAQRYRENRVTPLAPISTSSADYNANGGQQQPAGGAPAP